MVIPHAPRFIRFKAFYNSSDFAKYQQKDEMDRYVASESGEAIREPGVLTPALHFSKWIHTASRIL